MTATDHLRRLWAHASWADSTLLERLQRAAVPPDVLREFAHIIGAEEVWLSRLAGRAATAPVWPNLELAETADLLRETHPQYAQLIDGLADDDLGRGVAYTNSAGRAFTTPVGDILLHVMLHGQYHRGKINLLLRRAGLEPAPLDVIAWVRGAPAATAVPGPPW